MENTNGKEPAFPLQPTFNTEGQICNETYKYEGLTKREYFAAMAKTPDAIIQMEIEAWRGDNNRLPPIGTQDYYRMLSLIAKTEAAYADIKADALLTQLNNK